MICKTCCQSASQSGECRMAMKATKPIIGTIPNENRHPQLWPTKTKKGTPIIEVNVILPNIMAIAEADLPGCANLPATTIGV